MKTRVLAPLLGMFVLLLLSSLAQAGTNVTLRTSAGSIEIELDPDRAPLSVANFLKYVDAGFYDGTVFHRVIEGFVVQGGGYTSSLKSKKTYAPIKLESRNGRRNLRYTVAMARSPDPHSATSQFFINVVDNPRLDYPDPDGHGYAVFGQVVGGFEVVDKIEAAETTTKAGMADVPVETILIHEVVRTEGGGRKSGAR